ncbi:TraB/GumN family protein [Sphingobium sp. MK2]|uniref:TraB/GumN family protein n=1 Tax=Sphingobium sp. MK2 TaxID=3116540 RepID=UPI0032E36344
MKMLAYLAHGLAAALLLTSGPVAARPAPPATSVATPALWRVRDADTTLYLFGTVHVMKPDVDWFRGGVKAAFDRSDELVLEIIEPDDPNAMGAIMMPKALAQDGVALSDRLTPEAREKYRAAMADNALPVAAFDRMNPWMAGMALAVAPLAKMGYQADLGAEKILRAEAKKTGKRVEALETVEQQIDFFATLPMEQQVAFLNATVDGLPEMETKFAALLRHWQAGDPKKLGKSMNESLEATPELAQILLIGRNANWAQWIKARMTTPGTIFVAVGAGHLAGKGSVQDQLKTLGIKARRIKE